MWKKSWVSRCWGYKVRLRPGVVWVDFFILPSPGFCCPIILSLCCHQSLCASLPRSHHPSRVPVSHQSCAASCLILPSPIIEGLNYWACQPLSGEPFVMWTGLDRTEQGLVWVVLGRGGNMQSALKSICPFPDFICFCIFVTLNCVGFSRIMKYTKPAWLNQKKKKIQRFTHARN